MVADGDAPINGTVQLSQLDRHEKIPGKDKSFAEIDSLQRKQEAAIEIQQRYRAHRSGEDGEGEGRLKPSERWDKAFETLNIEQRKGRPESNDNSVENRSMPSESRSSHHSTKWAAAKDVILQLHREGQFTDEEFDGPDGDAGSSSDDSNEKRLRFVRTSSSPLPQGNKVMESQHWLELIDPKHRYGSNLKVYHRIWKKQEDHTEPFLYWLDEGGGKDINLQACPRDQLESEQVRYLSRDQRLNYLVKVNEQGLLVWAHSGALIDTTVEFRDSEKGIVPANSSAKALPVGEEGVPKRRSSTSTSSSSSSSSGSSRSVSPISGTERADRYVNAQSGLKKVMLVSPSAIMNRLLRKTTKKNTWIYVTDKQYRLYLGIKQSGAFQHSSFLHGGRVTGAGLMEVHQGQVTKLSPLSGHYRCSSKHFKAFLKVLDENHVDMTNVHVSRSYAVLVGVEGIQKMKHGREKIVQTLEKLAPKVMQPKTVKE